jgi:hypothetical protein
VSGAGLADHAQLAGRPGYDRVSVHGRAVERRHVERAGEVLGEDSAEGVAERHFLGRQRPHGRQHELPRFADRTKIGHWRQFSSLAAVTGRWSG